MYIGSRFNGKTIETGTFTTREEGEKSFTRKLSIDIETNKKKCGI